jgi:hypothetical protein
VKPFQHVIRIILLMASTAGIVSWELRHTETRFADGLRYVRQAKQIDRGDWHNGLVGSIDHPLHPLGIVATHGLVGGDGPVSWQQAAIVLAVGCIVLLVIPLYLLAGEAVGEDAAWLGCLLIIANPLLGLIVANVLSESSFLLFWTWGLWAAIRFLREGRFFWLPLTIGFGVLAYLSRPEGLLLPVAMVLTLSVLPLRRATRINWPRWRAAVAFLVLGSLALAGPYMVAKGRVGTKPAIARVLGLAPPSPPESLERERPLPPDQSTQQTYRLATESMLKVVCVAVTTPLVPLALLGLIVMPPGPARARIRLFFGFVLLASALGLVRLHATAGYCTARHGLVPALILTLAAAHGITWLLARMSIPGDWLGAAGQQLHPGPAVWVVLLTAFLIGPRMRDAGRWIPGPFHAYRDAGAWLAQNVGSDESTLDLTDWSLFFSGRPGYRFADVYETPADSSLRWVIARRPDLDGNQNYPTVVRQLLGRRKPVAQIPAEPEPGQLQLLIYDRRGPVSAVAAIDSMAGSAKIR